MTTDEIKYALAKQLIPDYRAVTIDTPYGSLYLDGDLAWTAIAALRHVLDRELRKREKSE